MKHLFSKFLVAFFITSAVVLSWSEYFSKSFFESGPLNEDQEMMYRHGEQYGDGVPRAEAGEGRYYFLAESGLQRGDFEFPPYMLATFKVSIALTES